MWLLIGYYLFGNLWDVGLCYFWSLGGGWKGNWCEVGGWGDDFVGCDFCWVGYF